MGDAVRMVPANLGSVAVTSLDSVERAADPSLGETVRTVSLRSAAASSTVSAPSTPGWRSPVCPRHPQW